MKKNKKLKQILAKILLIVYTLSDILLIINIIKLNNIENILRIIIILILLIVNTLLLFINIKKKKNIIPIIFTIPFIIINMFINYNFDKIYTSLNKVTKSYEEYTLTLVTLSDNKVNNINEIDDNIGVITQNKNIVNGYNFAKEILTKNNIKYKLIEYEEYLDIVKDLYNGKIKYAFLPESYPTMFLEHNEFKDINTKLKKVHEDKKKEKIETVSKDVNKPFSILLMGVDTLESSYNADTLLLITFNPDTLNATMLSIPRDTYTTIACTGGKHKINSSGWYSDKCVVDTVSSLVNINIDYYAKINFTGIVDLVDNLKGIDVDVVYPFCEQNSKREFGSNMIYVEEGPQHLNGEQALALTRNRHTWPECPAKYNEKGSYNTNLRNDITRGLNQQLVLKSILNEISKIKDPTIVYSLLDTISNNVETNMDKNTILSFYNIFKNIITSSGNGNIDNTFNIQKLSLEVYGTYINISGLNLSMIIAHQNSINKVSEVMKENLGLQNKKVIKTLSFDINNKYEEITIGKGIYGGTTLNLLKDLTGKNYQDAVRYCDEINYTCKFTYTEITDKTYTNNQIISQNIPGNYDMSLIRDKTITFEIAKVDKESKFDYKLCTKKEYQNNNNCIIPDFTNKDIKYFNEWYKNFGYITIKINEDTNDKLDNNIILKQNISNISIYELQKNNKILEITKNKIKQDETKPTPSPTTTPKEDNTDDNKDEPKDDENKESIN